MIEKRPLWTSAGDTEKKPGMLMRGMFSGLFQLRELGTRTDFFTEEFIKDIGKGKLPKIIEFPELALNPKYLKESGKRAFLETMSSIVAPLEAVMRANRKLETAYGFAQGTSKDMNTLLMLDVFYWMNNYWNEYSGDFGYAVDGVLHMSRELMYVYLKEEGLIWPEKRTGDIEGWDTISRRLLKDLPEDLWIGVPVGTMMYPEPGSIKVSEDSDYAKAPTKPSERDTILAELRAEITR